MLAFGCGKTPTLKENNIPSIVKAMTVEEKAHLLVGGNQNEALTPDEEVMIAASKKMVPGCAGFTFPIPRLGIPSVVMADGPAGLRIASTREGTDSTFYCTGFPIGTLLSSTWDPALVEKACAAIGNEVREYGVDVLLAPSLNLQRNPLCGRNFEYFSEDPLLSGIMAAAYVNGAQSEGVGTSLKVLAANNEEVNRLANDSRVSLRALRELYLKTFEVAVNKSQPWTIMTSYNYLDGRYTSENHALLNDILRGDWGYKGLVISDWGGGYDAVAQIKAGNDLLCPGNDKEYQAILKAINDGTLSMEEVDACVTRILQMIVNTPTFKKYKHSDAPDLKAHAKIAREVAAEGMVLLKNNKALPLYEGERIAMFGTNSYSLYAGGTGAGDVNKAYTISLDKALPESGLHIYERLDSVYRSFIAIEGAQTDSLNAARGWWYGKLPYPDMTGDKLKLYAWASSLTCDAAIITIVRQSGEGRDRHVEDDFCLKDSEKEMITEVSTFFHNAGKKVIVVLNVSGAMETASWKELPDAILVAWQPGQEAGYAIADVLMGTVNPSGHLPMTLPVSYEDVPSQNFPHVDLPDQKNGSWWHHNAGTRYYEQKDIDWVDYTEDVFMGYRYYTTFDVKPSYPFGYGLSYTDFSFKDMAVTPTKAKGDEPAGWNVTVKVTNTGEVAGKTVVQLYSQPLYGLNAPFEELRAFAKTSLLQPGESQTVMLHLSVADLAFFDEDKNAWVADAEEYGLLVSKDAASPVLSDIVHLSEPYYQPVSNTFQPVRMVGADGSMTRVAVDSSHYEPSPVFIDSSSVRLQRPKE